MVQPKSTARLSRINKVVLTQTDTTVGFLSQDSSKLYEIKSRDTSKEFIKVFPNLKALRDIGYRVPQSQKNLFRRSKKTTFIINNNALRISPSALHSELLRISKWNYSTSANESGKSFLFDFCEDKADIIIEDKDGLYEKNASSLIKLNHIKKVKLR